MIPEKPRFSVIVANEGVAVDHVSFRPVSAYGGLGSKMPFTVKLISSEGFDAVNFTWNMYVRGRSRIKVDDAVQCLYDELSLKDKVKIAHMDAEEVEDLHYSLDQFIRNRFGLCEGNPHLLSDCAEDAGQDIQSADEASAVILGRL